MEEIVVPPMERAFVSTGVCACLPPGVYGRIAPRSGLRLKHGIQTGAGAIDADFTGEVKVILYHNGRKALVNKEGNRIAQMILERCETPLIEEVTELKSTQRGERGFGSSGN